MKRKTVWFICIILLSFIVRALLIYFALQFSENTDILRWKDWTRIAFLYGFADTYTTAHIQFGTLPNNMPPGTLYLQYIMYYIGIQISKIVLFITHMPDGSIQWLNGPLITLLFRFPGTVSDLVIGSIIYRIIKKFSHDPVKPLVGMALFLFNPVVLYNSAVWGQMDAVVNIFFVASLYGIFNKKIVLSMLFFLLSLYIKLSLVYFLPFLMVLWWMRESKKKMILYSIIITFIGFFLILPINGNPFIWFVTYLQNNAIGEMTNITAYAFNIWWLSFRPFAVPEGVENAFVFSSMHLIGSPDDSIKYLGIPLFWYGIAAFTVLLIPIACRMMKKNITNTDIVKNFSMIALLAFLVLPRMHERYMYPVFPLLSICAVQSPWSIAALILLSMFNMINIYIVWHPMVIQFFPYTVWGQKDIQWMLSLITVSFSCFLYIRLILSDQERDLEK